MNKYLMIGAAALALGGASLTSCSNEKDLYDPTANAQKFLADYAEAFYKVFGTPDQNQDWGFGDETTTRSAAAPEVADIVAPYDEAWVATYNETAKEPNSVNVEDNYDNTVYHEGTPGTYAANYSAIDDWDVWNNMYTHGDWDAQVAWLLANGKESWLTYTPGTEGYWEYDENFVRNFKITDTYSGAITVVETEGLTDGVANNCERTVVVTGTWNITANQKVGSKGRIIIANGGTVNVAEGVQLNMVNQARLVVLAGGKLTGAGKVEVNNGNAEGEENYNAGTVDVAVFNNNFGKFYNYGKFLVNEYHGGAAESNFYNHALAAIDHFGIYDSSTANARIFNGCQFYVKNDARIRNYEGVGGSALIVGGQLMFSGSEDGTTTPTYVGLAAGALVQAGSLYNNGTSWTGPTSGGYAVLNIGKFDFMNWEQDHPELGGYFANNIYLVADDLSNVPDGNGYHQTDPSDAANYALSIAEYKFENIVANATGNGNVTVAEKGTYEVIPADDDFVLGKSGCTPGFKIKEVEVRDASYDVCIIAEDLSASEKSDFDFNDVVFNVTYDNETTAKVQLLAAGGTLPLTVAGREVHAEFGYPNIDPATGKLHMINTGVDVLGATAQPFTVTGLNRALKGKDIVIKVKKGNTGDDSVDWIELTANKGEAAAKIAVTQGFEYCKEFQDINGKYPLFNDWVQDKSVVWYPNVEWNYSE